MSERGMRGPEGEPGQDGRDGAPGPVGPQGPQGEQGLQGPAGKDGRDGRDGVDGSDGAQGPQGTVGPAGPAGKDGARGAAGPRGPAGEDGEDGQDGPVGPMPDHRWRGTELAFQNPDGSFGRYVDLKGPQGASGGGGGAGMTKTQTLQLNTLLAIFGGWISTVPDVAIEEVTIDELAVTVEGSATGFYFSIPGGEPVEAQYEWDWGDGSMTVDELTAEHTYAEAGTYTITFRAKNHIGWSALVEQEVEVSGEAPTTDAISLIHADETTGTTTIADVAGRDWVASGAAATNADSAMWGSAGMKLTGSGWFQTDEPFILGDTGQPWTIEFWIRTTQTTTACLLDNYHGPTGSWQTYMQGGTTLGFYSEGGAGPSVAADIFDGDFHHVAFVAYETAGLAIYVDGARLYFGPASTAKANHVATHCRIGAQSNNGNNQFNGAIDDLRVKNVAVYSGATITVPTGPLT